MGVGVSVRALEAWWQQQHAAFVQHQRHGIAPFNTIIVQHRDDGNSIDNYDGDDDDVLTLMMISPNLTILCSRDLLAAVGMNIASHK